MEWTKQGLIFEPKGRGGWMQSHAQVPTPLLTEHSIRVYFSSRPESNLSLTTFVDLDINDPTKILRVRDTPILPLGKPGTFDEHGIMPSCAIRNGRAVFLYYSGWSRSVSVPYTNATGLAVSEDGGETFERISDGPILAKSLADPYSATSPGVLKTDTGWHMWYCSGTGWVRIKEKYEHTYDIKYASSENGIDWHPGGEPALAQRSEYEALTRPFVVQNGSEYRMWFCHRGSLSFRDGPDSYRIGCVCSNDLKQWKRNNAEEDCVPRSDHGWDSKMTAYPAVVRVKDRMLMFYNGNEFGVAGFGLAVSQI